MIAASQLYAAAPKTPITTATLGNGLKVIVQEDHSTDLVAIDIWVRAGSINETPQNNGVSHFIEHMLFKGTDKRASGQIDIDMECIGASVDAKTSRDWAHFYTTVAQKHVDQALEVLSDAIMHPKFRMEDVERERQIILDEIARSQSDPKKALENLTYQTAFTKHPYGLPVEGTQESVKGITQQMIADYYNRLYTPDNMSVVVVGDITAHEAAPAVQKAFSGFEKKQSAPILVTPEPVRTKQAVCRVKRDTNLTYLSIAYQSPSVKDQPDVYTMDVLMSYLGLGYQSWLSTELKNNQNLAIDTSSDFLAQRDPGLATLTVSMKPANVEKVKDAIFAKLDELRTRPISDGELYRAKRSIIGGFAFDIEIDSGKATTMGFYDAIDKVDFAGNYVQNINKVSAQDIQELAKRYLTPEKAVVVEVGP